VAPSGLTGSGPSLKIYSSCGEQIRIGWGWQEANQEIASRSRLFCGHQLDVMPGIDTHKVPVVVHTLNVLDDRESQVQWVTYSRNRNMPIPGVWDSGEIRVQRTRARIGKMSSHDPT
jgi:hypothetical protein